MSSHNNSSSESSKIKVLLVGCIETVEAAQAVTAKLAALHAHKTAGPFDVAFGACHNVAALEYWIQLQAQTISGTQQQHGGLVIPLYLQDTNAATQVALQQQQLPVSSKRETDTPPAKSEDTNNVSNKIDEMKAAIRAATKPLQLAPNLYVLRDTNAFAPEQKQVANDDGIGTTNINNNSDPMSGIWRLLISTNGSTVVDDTVDTRFSQLVVASLPPQFRLSTTPPATTTASRSDSATNQSFQRPTLQETIRNVSYTGCDLLLSTEWPQGIETLLSSSSTTNNSRLLSFDVADIAAQAKARYHVALMPSSSSTSSTAASLQFVQTPAFVHIASTTSTTTSTSTSPHSGRFLALCAVQTKQAGSAGTATASTLPTISNSKAQKCIHAVGIVPLHSQGTMAGPEAGAGSVVLAPCPYTDVSYKVDNGNDIHAHLSGTQRHLNARGGGGGLSEAAARRILVEDRQQAVSMQSGNAAFRWNVPSGQTSKRPRRDNKSEFESSVDSTNTTLFLYGLHKDVTGRLQQCNDENGLLIDTFRPMGVTAIRKPPHSANHHANTTTSFCFLEFDTHDQALQCLQATGGEITVAGVALQLKWATTAPASQNHNSNENPATSTAKRPRLTEREARDSSTVYFRYTLESNANADTVVSLATLGEELRQWMERTLEVALLGDDSKDKNDNNACADDDNAVKASDEPALQVQLRLPASAAVAASIEGATEGADGLDAAAATSAAATETTSKRFGFLDFASHAAASMALAILTGSTDGGRVLAEQQEERAKSIASRDSEPSAILGSHIGLYLHWGMAQKPSGTGKTTDGRNVIEDGESQFKFERKHFPADSRKDCWFCLASPSCEKHLITGVYNTCYAAMPKGAVHPGHILLVPVQHGSQGAWKDSAVSHEIEDLKQKLRRHATVAYDADLFVFERAIQTKGGYHTHVQCIPVERRRGFALQATMLTQAKKLGFELREINSDVGIRAVLTMADDDDNKKDTNDGGYFYAEIPMGGMEYKRFLYQKSAASASAGSTRVNAPMVPLQFGREILAAVLGDPNLAHWKSCVVDTDKETSMAVSFRESLAKLAA